MNDAEEFVELIIKNMKSFGVKVNKNFINKKKRKSFTKGDVSGEKFKKIDINRVVENIILCESMLEEDINLELVNNLMRFYQMAIEFYSSNDAYGPNTYLTFVQK